MKRLKELLKKIKEAIDDKSKDYKDGFDWGEETGPRSKIPAGKNDNLNFVAGAAEGHLQGVGQDISSASRARSHIQDWMSWMGVKNSRIIALVAKEVVYQLYGK